MNGLIRKGLVALIAGSAIFGITGCGKEDTRKVLDTKNDKNYPAETESPGIRDLKDPARRYSSKYRFRFSDDEAAVLINSQINPEDPAVQAFSREKFDVYDVRELFEAGIPAESANKLNFRPRSAEERTTDFGLVPSNAISYNDIHNAIAILKKTTPEKANAYDSRFSLMDVETLVEGDIPFDRANSYPTSWVSATIISATQLRLEPAKVSCYADVRWMTSEKAERQLLPDEVDAFDKVGIGADEAQQYSILSANHGYRLTPREASRLKQLGLTFEETANRLKETEIKEILEKKLK